MNTSCSLFDELEKGEKRHDMQWQGENRHRGQQRTVWVSGGRGYFRQTSRGTSRRSLIASWSESSSRAGGGKGNRWEVGERES